MPGILISISSNICLPEPMVLKQKMYLFNWNLLCFRQEEKDEVAHDEDFSPKKIPSTEFLWTS